MLNSSLYVDDLFSGTANVAEALKLTAESIRVLRKEGMNLRKFETNSQEHRRKWII